MSVTYLDDLARIRVEAAIPDGNTVAVDVQRTTDGITWVFVRGGERLPAQAGTTVRLDDYEFPVSEPVTYRVLRYNDGGALIGTEAPGSITVDLATVWLKSLTRPFLNRSVVLADFGELTRASRNGVFQVVGRTVPVAVTDVRMARQQDITLLTSDQAERRDLDLVLAAGDPMFLHAPDDCGIDSMYVVVGDTSVTRTAYRYTKRRLFTLPLTEVAAAHHSIVGSTVSWQGILNAFATWADLIADEATWADVLDRLGDPADVIVP